MNAALSKQRATVRAFQDNLDALQKEMTDMKANMENMSKNLGGIRCNRLGDEAKNWSPSQKINLFSLFSSDSRDKPAEKPGFSSQPSRKAFGEIGRLRLRLYSKFDYNSEVLQAIPIEPFPLNKDPAVQN